MSFLYFIRVFLFKHFKQNLKNSKNVNYNTCTLHIKWKVPCSLTHRDHPKQISNTRLFCSRLLFFRKFFCLIWTYVVFRNHRNLKLTMAFRNLDNCNQHIFILYVVILYVSSTTSSLSSVTLGGCFGWFFK